MIKDQKKGQKISYEDISFKRPGTGISPHKINKVLNKIKKNIFKDQLLTFKHFK